MPDKAQNRPTQITNVDAPLSVYSNNAEVNVTTWDFRFKFSEIEKISPEGIAVAERVRVVMSPQHAKVFSRLLADHIAKYERVFGEINVEGVPDPEATPAR